MLEASLSILLLILASSPDEPPQERLLPVLEQTIVVTPERDDEQRMNVPAAVSVIDRDSIKTMPASNLSQIVEQVPGVVVYHSEGLTGRPIVLNRGFFGGGEVDYLSLLVDSVNLSRAESGLAEWDLVPTLPIQRLEVVRGPLSTLYGDGAMGGVVQAFSRETDAGGRLSIAAGNFEQRDFGFHYQTATRVPLSASLSRLVHDGAREHGASETTFAQLSAGPSDQVWRLDLMHLESERHDSGALPLELARSGGSHSDPLFERDVDTRRRTVIQGVIEPRSLPLTIAGRASTFEGDSTRTIILFPGFGDTAERQIDGSTFGTSVDFRWSHGEDLFLRAGVDGELSRIDSSYRSAGASASGDRGEAAIFATAYWSVTDRARLIAGARYDRLDDQFTGADADHEAWSPRIGMTYRLPVRRPVALYFQASRSFKAPTLDQMFDVRPLPDFQGGTFTIANPSLQPQTATNFELGASSSTERFNLESSIYHMQVDDEIDFDLATFRYQNIAESIHRGAEVSAWWRLDRVRPGISYSWTSVRPRGGENSGRQLKNIPIHTLGASAQLDLPAGIRGGLLYKISWDRYLDDENLLELDPLETLDLRLSRPFGRFEAVVDLFNILDDRGAAYGYWLTGLDGQPVPFAYPSAPFSFRIGLNIDL